jgi:hypothetical protein
MNWRAMIRRLLRRDRTVYVVAGFMRSGTTAMMQGLEAGGLRVDRAPKGDPLREFYELSEHQKARGWYSEGAGTVELPPGQRFPSAHRGRLIKCLVGSARYLDPQPVPIKVVFMRRDIQEIAESGRRLTGIPYQQRGVERSVEHELKQWRARPDVQLVEVWYGALLANPEGVYDRLQAAGWPIDARRATRAIDPTKRTVFRPNMVNVAEGNYLREPEVVR